MENLAITLFIGIFSSLVATLLFIFMSELVRKVFIPWYADKIYRGVRIDGDWVCNKLVGIEFHNSDDLSMSMVLFQNGEVIKGSYTHKIDGNIDQYSIEGKIKDMCFLATAVPKSNRHIDAMSLLLKISNVKSNLLLTGNILHIDTSGAIKSSEVQFKWENS